jgi:hypothetical protein
LNISHEKLLPIHLGMLSPSQGGNILLREFHLIFPESPGNLTDEPNRQGVETNTLDERGERESVAPCE